MHTRRSGVADRGRGRAAAQVGANIGAFTVPLAKLVGATGVVHAIEPLRVLHNLMVANAALNGCDNVASHRAYVGNATLSPRHALALHHDYLTLSNYGSYSAASQPASLVEKVGTTAVENVGTIAIDDLGLWGCTLIKIDVEGAEMGVLQGAQETIAKFKPAIYTEAEPPRPERPNSDFARVGGVLDVLNGLDYECFQHLVPLWRPDNHRGAPAFFLPNGSPTTHLKSANALCVHWSEIHDLPPALQRRRPMKVGEAITMTGENSRPEGLDTVHIPGALHDEV